jgi:nicotinate-nucleotide pyrophosphorylase (carboxylating)
MIRDMEISLKGNNARIDDQVDAIIKLALIEDIRSGDITSNAIIDPRLHAVGRISAKQSLVLSGMDVAKRVFELLDPETQWDAQHEDGERCEVGDIIAIVQGPALALLQGERTAINFLQHLSGIATTTARFVEEIHDTNTKILDTRKTTPGMRTMEKHAVKMGGGTNHRMGLYDHFLIKNNHIAVAGSMPMALKEAIAAKKPGQLVEVEARTLSDVETALKEGADIIMLDNMSVQDTKKAVSYIKGRTKLEASGNITLDNVHSYASTGVDFVSVGAITHSSPSADINMLTIIEKNVGEQSISTYNSPQE